MPWATFCLLDTGSTRYLGGRRLYSLALPVRSGLTVGWLYVEIERLSPHELLCAVGLDMFVYVYDVLYMRVISPIWEIDVIGRWLAWLALMQRFDW